MDSKLTPFPYLPSTDSKLYVYDDFCSYGPRFIDFLQQSGLFKPDEVILYLFVAKQYGELHPPEIWTLRAKLLTICADFGIRPEGDDATAMATGTAQGSGDSSSTNGSSGVVEGGDCNNNNINEAEVDFKPEVDIDYKMVTFKSINPRY